MLRVFISILILLSLFVPKLDNQIVIDSYSIQNSNIVISFVKNGLSKVIIDNLCFIGNNKIITSLNCKFDEIIDVKCIVNDYKITDRIKISKNINLSEENLFLGIRIKSIDNVIKIKEQYYKFDFINKEKYQNNNGLIRLNEYFDISVCYDNLYCNLLYKNCVIRFYLPINTLNCFPYLEDSYYEFPLNNDFDGYVNKFNFKHKIFYDLRNFLIVSYQDDEEGDDFIYLPKGNRIREIKCLLVFESLFDKYDCKIPWIIEYDHILFSNDYNGDYHLISGNDSLDNYEEERYI